MCGVMKDSMIGLLWWGEGHGELKATRSCHSGLDMVEKYAVQQFF